MYCTAVSGIGPVNFEPHNEYEDGPESSLQFPKREGSNVILSKDLTTVVDVFFDVFLSLSDKRVGSVLSRFAVFSKLRNQRRPGPVGSLNPRSPVYIYVRLWC